jgi:hypothetical protein
MSREPRRVECTICTAIAPDAIFTVRTNATNEQPTCPISVQIQPARTTKPQVSELRTNSDRGREPSQV